MKKLLYILLSFISIQATAQIEQPRIKFNQVIKDSTGSGRIVISSLTDSNMIYSTDFYINPTDSLLIFFGDTIVGGGTLSSVLVDSVYIFGDGSTTPLTFSTEKLHDTLNTFLQAGLGISIDYNDEDGELTISSLTIQDSVYNGTGSTIYKGTPLYADNAQGNYWSVAPASNTDINKLPVVAIAGDNIPSGEVGLALIKGHIKGVNTSMFSPGDEIWVGADGTYTNIKPKGGNVYLQSLGTVVKSNENGTGIINIQDVQLTLAPNEIFIGGADSLITSISLPTVISDSLNNYLALSDYIVDSTRLTQDSILVYYQNGTIIRQDTISGVGGSAGGGLNVYQQTFTVTTDSSFTLSNAPVSKEYVIVAENGLVIDNDLFSVTGTSLDLTYMPQEGQLTAIWFEGSGGSGGLSSVSVDSLTIYGDGLTTPLYVDTTFMTTKRYVDSVAATLGTGDGTVTSVDVSGGTTGLTTSGGPVTASGTITLAGTLNVANGGTGSTTKNFVDLSTAQTVGGAKTFTSDITVQNEETNTNAAELNLYKKNGSSSGDVTVGDNIGNINFKAENGATTVTSASIEVDATTVYNNEIGGDMVFKTASEFHSRPLTEAMRIDKLGNISLDSTLFVMRLIIGLGLVRVVRVKN